jgi:hypothetical protein
MSEIVSKFGRRRFRWSLGSMMIGMAASSVILALMRPLATPAHLRAAEDVLQEYGPRATPGFNPDNYQVEKASQTPRGWVIHYVRIAGTSLAETDVLVANQVVQKYRFNPWASLDTTSATKPRPLMVPPPARALNPL